jgi:hypothetical protein
LVVIAGRFDVRMMETLVEELTVGETVGEITGAFITAIKKKLFY